jgi:tetratricopeptide (TPR) repeat protein
VPPGRLLSVLRRRFAEASDVVELRTTPRGPVHFALGVTGDATVLWVAGGPSNTLHHENAQWADETEQETTAKWAADVLMLAATHLNRIGLLPAAARVAALAVEDATVVNHPGVAQDTVHLLVDGNRLDDAFRLIGRLTHTDMTEAAVGALIGLLETSRRLGREEQEQIVVTLLGWAEANERAGESGRAAQFTYSAARSVGADDPPRAIQLFERAAERDPGYRQRDYWHREIAGLFFLSGNYQEAADAYRRALDLDNAESRPLLADALMFSGRYQEALDQFSEVVANEELSKPEWRLKQTMLGFLTRVLGIGQQVRRVEEAARSASDEALDRDGLLDALKMDALCAEALYRIGQLVHQAGDRSVEWFVASALAAPRTPIAWFAAMAFASEDAPDMFEDVARCARRFSGDDLIQLLLETDPTGAGAAEMMTLFEGLPPDPSWPLEVRLTTPGSSEYAVIRLPDDEPPPPTADDAAPA